MATDRACPQSARPDHTPAARGRRRGVASFGAVGGRQCAFKLSMDLGLWRICSGKGFARASIRECFAKQTQFFRRLRRCFCDSSIAKRRLRLAGCLARVPAGSGALPIAPALRPKGRRTYAAALADIGYRVGGGARPGAGDGVACLPAPLAAGGGDPAGGFPACSRGCWRWRRW
jgi:hypothetical protein